MSKEEIINGLERLRKIKKEMSDLVSEAEGIIKDCDYKEWERAQGRWIPQIESALNGKFVMRSMDDTILVLEGLLE